MINDNVFLPLISLFHCFPFKFSTFDPLQAVGDWNGNGMGLPNCQQCSVESMFRVRMKRTFRCWVNEQETTLDHVRKRVCADCVSKPQIPSSRSDTDMNNSKFVLGLKRDEPRLFYRRAVYTSAHNSNDPEALLQSMQWFGELWVFWFEFSRKPLRQHQDTNEWIINKNELISHVCLVWYSDGVWFSLDQAGISDRLRTEPSISLLDCMRSPQTLRWGFAKYYADSPIPSCLCKFHEIFDIPHIPRSKPKEGS